MNSVVLSWRPANIVSIAIMVMVIGLIFVVGAQAFRTMRGQS